MVAIGIFFAVAAIPTFLLVKERSRPAPGYEKAPLSTLLRAGIRELILPKACERDYQELLDYIKEGMTVHFAQRYQDVHDVVWG